MSYRSGQYSEVPQHHAHDHGRSHSPAPGDRAAPLPICNPAQNGYTIAHAGKQVRFGPVVFWIVVGTVTVLGAWSAATATYFAFRDDVLTRLIARQAEMQYAYEDRIAELRAKVDRTTSRQLLDQEQFDQKLDQIMRRQTTLESRATALSAIPDASVTGSIKPPRGAAATDAGSSGMPKPSPINDTVIFVAPPDREARLESRTPPVVNPQPNQFAKIQGVDNVLVRLQTSLDQVERRQMAALSSVEDSMESRVRRMRGVIHRPRPRHGATGSRDAARGHGRPVRSGQASRRCRPVRAPALSHQHHPRPGRAAEPDAGAGALSQAGDRRSRIHLRLRGSQRSIPGPSRDAYRPRFPRLDRRSGARDRQRQGRLVGMGRRLRPHGRDRPWQRTCDPLRPYVGDPRQGRRSRSRSDR